jgi:hypothetical protein
MSKTSLLYGALRTRILDFDPMGAGTSLRSRLSGGLHTHSAPDNCPVPYGVMLLEGRRTGSLDDGALEEEGNLRVSLYSRDRSRLAALEDAMDTVEEALLRWSTTDVGWLMVRRLTSRITAPAFPAPANAEIVHIRGVWRYTWWPDYRTQYAVAAGEPAP